MAQRLKHPPVPIEPTQYWPTAHLNYAVTSLVMPSLAVAMLTYTLLAYTLVRQSNTKLSALPKFRLHVYGATMGFNNDLAGNPKS